MKHPNPFYSGNYAGHETFAIDSTSRIERVKQFNEDECRRALNVPDLQKTVRQAVERRMRKLQKGAA